MKAPSPIAAARRPSVRRSARRLLGIGFWDGLSIRSIVVGRWDLCAESRWEVVSAAAASRAQRGTFVGRRLGCLDPMFNGGLESVETGSEWSLEAGSGEPSHGLSPTSDNVSYVRSPYSGNPGKNQGFRDNDGNRHGTSETVPDRHPDG